MHGTKSRTVTRNIAIKPAQNDVVVVAVHSDFVYSRVKYTLLILIIVTSVTSNIKSCGHLHQNKVRVLVGGLTRFANMTDWMRKAKRSIITERR